ncbi:MAG: hypothetical protein ACODAD_15805 [Planctomycetota bacterium]
MTKNPILDELHATRERLLAESGGTVSGLLDRLRADQAATKRPIHKPANHAIQRSGGGDVSDGGESTTAAR